MPLTRYAIDTSVVIEMMLEQPMERRLKAFLAGDGAPCISSATRVELASVAFNKLGDEGIEIADGILTAYSVSTIAFAATHMAAAIEGYRRYGRGTGHPARLNFGDAYTYGFAKAEGIPLLFVGDDFVHTDLEIALPLPD